MMENISESVGLCVMGIGSPLDACCEILNGSREPLSYLNLTKNLNTLTIK